MNGPSGRTPREHAAALTKLLGVDPFVTTFLNELGAGRPDPALRAKLAGLTPAAVGCGRTVQDGSAAAASLSGLWLRFDFLDESHRISQDLHTGSGSFWHGIMHRREGDFWNSKYWFRNVGSHPAYAEIRTAVAEFAAGQGSVPKEVAALAGASRWEPDRFVDLCAAAEGGEAALQPICREIQRLEWEVLFEYCRAEAFGAE